mmetsp:Transcript_9943/g.42299  ORF Transcript_9943/g.42299 Transcript_9943/m.42299 type:complete len:223 (+) Transcript_9943:2125-2793(+)
MIGNSVHVAYVMSSKACRDRRSSGCCTRLMTCVNNVRKPRIIMTNKAHETPMETTRTNFRSATNPNAPASNIRLFTSEIAQTSHDVDMSSSLSFRFCAARRRRNVRAKGYRRELAAIADVLRSTAPPSPSVRLSSFVSSFFARVSCVSAFSFPSSSASDPSPSTKLARFSFSVRVIIDSTAILEIMSVDVTGHTANTRTALYSSMPSRSDRTSGTISRKSSE